MQVAMAAPNMPSPSGYMNTQSSTTLERLLVSMPAMASRGAPSLRTKACRVLFNKKKGAKQRMVRR